MNRIYSIITFLFLSIVATNAQKIGYINSQEILASLPEVKQANSDIEVMKTMFQKKGEDMVKELQTKYQDLQKKQQSGELAPVEIENNLLFSNSKRPNLVNLRNQVRTKFMLKQKSY